MNTKIILEQFFIGYENSVFYEELKKIMDEYPSIDICEEVYCVVDKRQECPIIGTVVTIRTMKDKDNTLTRYSVEDADGQMKEFSSKDIGVCLFRSILDANTKLVEIQK